MKKTFSGFWRAIQSWTQIFSVSVPVPMRVPIENCGECSNFLLQSSISNLNFWTLTWTRGWRGRHRGGGQWKWLKKKKKKERRRFYWSHFWNGRKRLILILSWNKQCFVMLQLISSNKFVKTKSCLSKMELDLSKLCEFCIKRCAERRNSSKLSELDQVQLACQTQ